MARVKTSQRRRANGEGTIYQDKDGRWCAQLPPDARTGKRREFWGATQAEAMDRRDAFLRRETLYGEAAETDPTLAAYLREWLEHTAKLTLRPHSWLDYRYSVEKRIIPEIGRVRMSALRAVDVRRMMEAIARRTSPRTANLTRAVLRKAINDARHDRVFIGDNPAAMADPLPQPHYEATWLDADTLRRFLAAVEGRPYAGVFTIAATMGLRRGEVLGLRWKDLNLDGETPTLTVAGQLKEIDRVPQHVDTKTAKSRRILPLAPSVVALLKAHKVAQAKRRLELGPLWNNPMGLVFTQDDGAPLQGNTVLKAFKRELQRVGLPVMRLHDLRHSAATLMLERSAGDLKTVSTALGHSTITLTANTYAHTSTKAVGRVIALLDDLVPRPASR